MLRLVSVVQAEPGSKVQFGRVLAHKANGSFAAGQPYLENVRVEAEILEELKGPKLIVRTRHLVSVPPRRRHNAHYTNCVVDLPARQCVHAVCRQCLVHRLISRLAGCGGVDIRNECTHCLAMARVLVDMIGSWAPYGRGRQPATFDEHVFDGWLLGVCSG